jgi:cell wall-associated NlpC family hydrolase
MKLALKFFTLLLYILVVGFSMNAGSATSIFSVTPNIFGPAQLITGEQGTALFQVTNNSGKTLNNIAGQQFPSGMSQIPSAGLQYCSAPFNLAPNGSCLLKININSAKTCGNVQGGPIVCFSASHPVYCSQPLAVNQLNTTVLPGPIPQSCNSNINNFTYELTQTLDSTAFTTGWGPQRNCLLVSPANPNLAACAANADADSMSWQQQRLIAAVDFWVKQKLSYCHHYLPDFNTLPASRNAAGTAGGYCNPGVDIYPNTPYYNQQARWNYSGTGSETINNWVNNNYMWYGVDCSDFTAFLYDFAFGTIFDSDTGYQAGQSATLTCAPPTESGHCQDNLSPNQQTAVAANELSNPNAAGTLVCADGTLEQAGTSFCTGHGDSHGNYISSIDSNGHLERTGSVTADHLATVLKPGDLLFIAGGGVVTSPTSSEVTHVIIWIGKQVGYGPNDIDPSRIAPDDICPASDWMPQIGEWVISDSHYQGADYRVLTPCFYLNNLWGVRRVIPVSVNGPEPVPNVNCQSHLSLKH